MNVYRRRRGTAPLIRNLCMRSNIMMMMSVWLQLKVPSSNKSALSYRAKF
jgi:hypothetical protein